MAAGRARGPCERRKMYLDKIDSKIMGYLQAHGRASAREVSEAVNLSPRATLARIRELEDAGHIQGYGAHLARATLGQHVAVFAEVVLKDQRKSTVSVFERHVAACPEVVACYLVSGRYDYLLRLGCRDLTHYRELTDAWLENLGLGIEKIVTSTELTTVKEFRGFPDGLLPFAD